MVTFLKVLGVASVLVVLFTVYGILNPMLNGNPLVWGDVPLVVIGAGLLGALIQSALCFGMATILERLKA